MLLIRLLLILLSLLFGACPGLLAQDGIHGHVTDLDAPVPFANVFLQDTDRGTSTDANGRFAIENIPDGTYQLVITALGYEPYQREISIPRPVGSTLHIRLVASSEQLDEMVVTGTLKAVRRSDSPVPVEVYSPTFIKKNPTANVFEALQMVNGVRPQINCNVCNTGDIHINGLEGPYTLVLIDGMPIVSGLGTVYGMSGIPNSLIEQVEIVKGPASTLYGSEAVGGLINIITRAPEGVPEFFADGFATGWGEFNLDAGGAIRFSENTTALLGVNYFNYEQPVDNNGDNFTDLTLQDRISVFQKWQVRRPQSRVFDVAARFFYEDRWGGEMQWTPEFRGGDSIYGESIYTRRWELLGHYQLPLREKIMFSFSYNDHAQNSVYGNTPYIADQRIGFGQLTWDRTLGTHDLLAGTAIRYNYYDDNTPATSAGGSNDPNVVWIPSLFLQDEWAFAEKQVLLTGIRYDYDPRHGSIFTPRIAYRWKPSENDVLRLNGGTGFRVVNLFTEEHAALTGAREVIIAEELKPERSWNINLNYLKKIYARSGLFLGLDASAFYTYFTNQILPDYDTNPNQIIYDNLDGTSVSRGFSVNLDTAFPNGIKAGMGATFQDVRFTENGVSTRPVLTEKFTGTWNISYTIRGWDLLLDYTGNLYGPMRLPLLGENDPRPEYSPIWSIQNVQLTYQGFEGFEIYAGVKNLLNWTPAKSAPFLISRAEDPFDKDVVFDAAGNPVATPNNPYGLTFDPSYVYGPNQGIRGFAGLRYHLN